jgi:sec-independent protein translocase protein TatB
MFNIGPGELLAIAAVALIVLGPQRLPQALRSVGRVIGELRRISGGFQDELRRAIDESEVIDEPDDFPEVRPPGPAAPAATTTPGAPSAPAAADGTVSVPPTTSDASAELDDDEPETMLLPADTPEPEALPTDGDDPGTGERAVS